MSCIFCAILAGTAPTNFVHRDQRVSAFMDAYPVNPGHVLVVPNQHAASLAELNPDDGAQMFRVAQQVAAALRRSSLSCTGVNLYLADGAAAGQSVFHTHLHVIPRQPGDGIGLRHAVGMQPQARTGSLAETAALISRAMQAASPDESHVS